MSYCCYWSLLMMLLLYAVPAPMARHKGRTMATMGAVFSIGAMHWCGCVISCRVARGCWLVKRINEKKERECVVVCEVVVRAFMRCACFMVWFCVCVFVREQMKT